MAEKVRPSLSKPILDNKIHWFEKSNTYIVLDAKTDQLFDLFLRSRDAEAFKSTLLSDNDLNLSINEIESIYYQLSNASEQLNQPIENHLRSERVDAFNPNKFYSTRLFEYRNIVFKINYGSDKIQNVFHPVWQHLSINATNSTNQSSTEFSIDIHENVLRLFRNKDLIAYYPKKDFHYLQGKLALELINLFYNKTEKDWLGTFHASAIDDGTSALLLVGASGSGKSTLTAILAANGYNLLADDISPMLTSNREIHRFPNAISIKEGAFKIMEDTIPGFSAIAATKSLSKNIDSKFVVPAQNFRHGSSYPCNTLLLVCYDAGGDNTLRQVDPEEILTAMIPDSWINPNFQCAEVFLDWLKDLNYLKLCYNDTNFAIESVDQIFRKNIGY